MRHKTQRRLQASKVDCSATCLGIVLAFYGHDYSNAQLRKSCSVSRDGATVAQIQKGSQALGHECEVLKQGIGSLAKEKGPIILHWEMNHFVVLEMMDDSYAWINDPAYGRRKLRIVDFKLSYTGISLRIVPTSEKKKTSSNPFLVLLGLINVKPSFFIVMFLAGLLSGLLFFAVAFLFGGISLVFFDYVVEYQMTQWSFYLVTVGIALTFLKGWISFLQKTTQNNHTFNVSASMKQLLVVHLFDKPIEFFDTHFTGELNGRLADLDASLNYIVRASWVLSASCILIIMCTITLAFLSPLIAVIQITPRFLFLIWKFCNTSETYELEISERDETIRYDLLKNQRFKGFTRLYSVGMERQLLAMTIPSLNRHLSARIRLRAHTIVSDTLSRSITMSSLPLTAFAGAFLLIKGDLTYGGFILSSVLAILLTKELDKFVKMISKYNSLLPVARTMCETLDFSTSSDSVSNFKSNRVELPSDPPLCDEINVKGVDFCFQGTTENLFTDLNLSINEGEIVNLSGASGSGKTTLLYLLAGIRQPQKGQVSYKGQPLEGYAPAGCVLWSEAPIFGSLADFVANGRRADPERLRDVIELTLLSERLGSFVNGDGKELLEKQGLSRGEVQKLMLAQALYYNDKYVIFDDAFNHISLLQSAIILNSIKARGVTMVMSTHRPEIQNLCDSVIVLTLN